MADKPAHSVKKEMLDKCLLRHGGLASGCLRSEITWRSS